VSEELSTAARYRLHAEELRTIAADKTAAQNRQILLGLAADYERMANTLEAIDTTNKALRRATNSN
jgi:predicted kinase